MSAPATTPLRNVLGPDKFNAWYETLIDLRIANPEMTQREMAARLGRAENWISLVVNSDAFKARYEKRRAEHSERISALVQDRLHAVANKALDRLADVLDNRGLKPEFVLDATDTLFERLGYSGKQPAKASDSQPAPNNVVIQVFQPVDKGTLAAAQQSIRHSEAEKLAAPPPRIDYSAPELETVPELEPPRADDTGIRQAPATSAAAYSDLDALALV